MLIVGIGGTTSAASSSERVLRHVLAACEAKGAEVVAFCGPDLDQPAYAYGGDRSPAASRMIEALRRADAVILSSPGYHGTVSGLFKNAVDYIEDLARDERPYLTDRVVGVIGVAAGWQAATATLGTLRTIVHALRGWPTPLGIAVNSATPIFSDSGEITDVGLLAQLALMADQVVSPPRFGKL